VFMEQLDLDKLPILTSFVGLKRFDTVYSKKYGLGQVHDFYGNDEIIVAFTHFKKRFSINEEEISIIPQHNLLKKKITVKVTHNGQKMSFKKFKLIKKQEKDEQERREQLEKELKSSPNLKIHWEKPT